MRRELHADVIIAVEARRVWNMLVNLPGWGQWNPVIPEIRGQLETGGQLTMRRSGSGVCKAECLRVLPAHELSWLWRWHLPGLLDREERFVIEPVEEGTRLLVRQRCSGILLPFAWPRLRRRAGGELRQMAAALGAAAEASA